jgi:hypothetical protein
MTRVRHGGYVFVTWIGDHRPRHVHIYRDGCLLVKWDLEMRRSIVGTAGPRLRGIIAALQEEGRL